MTDIANTTPAEPDGAPRLAVIDILRGIAILGILFMNINDMGQSMTASFGDVRHLGWTTADQIAWWLREVLANGTARCLLQMLFGVGMVILTDRFATAAGKWAALRRYYVRNIVLFVFGVVHMYILLWPGDILHTYALASLVAVLFRTLRPRFLLPIALIFATLQLGGAGFYVLYQAPRAEAKFAAVEAKRDAGTALTAGEKKVLKEHQESDDARVKRRAERTADIAKEDKGRLGTSWTWIVAQTEMSLSRFPTLGEIGSVWESAATMLIGAALFKLGIIQGSRSRRYYVWLTLLCYAVALPLRILGAWETTRFDTLPQLSWATNEYARLVMTLGHVGLVHVLLATVTGARLLKPLEAVGRTALSIYIGQTLICLWVLYPPFALHLYGEQGWMALMITASVVNVVLLWAANWYVQHYRIAPVEWAWRSLVEWRLLPIRTRAATPARGLAAAA